MTQCHSNKQQSITCGKYWPDTLPQTVLILPITAHRCQHLSMWMFVMQSSPLLIWMPHGLCLYMLKASAAQSLQWSNQSILHPPWILPGCLCRSKLHNSGSHAMESEGRYKGIDYGGLKNPDLWKPKGNYMFKLLLLGNKKPPHIGNCLWVWDI